MVIRNKVTFGKIEAKKLFSEISDQEALRIGRMFRDQFQAGYSPDANDWRQGEHGVGSGATARQYVAFTGYQLLDKTPDEKVMTSDEFWGVVRKCTII